MKKTLLSIALLSYALSHADAQTPVISNGSFESWSSPSGPLELEAPDAWSGSDKILYDLSPLIGLGGYDVTPQKQIKKITSSSATEGGVLAELETVNTGESIGFIPGVLINGDVTVNAPALLSWISSGDGDITSIFDISNASPMFGRTVDSVKVDANCWGESALKGSIIVNAIKKVGDDDITIGTGTVLFNNTTVPGDLEEYTVHIDYSDAHEAEVDTLIILLLSSAVDPDAPAGSGGINYVRADNVRLYTSAPLSIRSIANTDLGIVVYPNPADEYIIFNNSGSRSHKMINIYSMNGQIMEQRQLKEGENEFSLSKYAAGVYSYEIIDTEKNARQTGQFIK